MKVRQFICIFLFSIGCRVYGSNVFIEYGALFIDEEVSISSADIVYNSIYFGDNVYVYNFIDSYKKKTISKYFPEILFLNSFQMFLYRIYHSIIARSDVKFYVESDREIKYLEFFKLKYTEILRDIDKYNNSNVDIIKLKNKYGKNILIAYELRESIKHYLDKNEITVVDGDTVIIYGNSYRLLGIDAPEKKQEYGDVATYYLSEIISKAKTVSISVSEFDIYNRILAHLYLDDIPVAYSMIKNKYAIQTITTYGDNGFRNISSNIIEYSKSQGRLPFLNPATYRDRVSKGETNNLTVKKTSTRKKPVAVKKRITAKKPKVSKSLNKNLEMIDAISNDNVEIIDESIVSGQYIYSLEESSGQVLELEEYENYEIEPDIMPVYFTNED